ncbi:Uncharacterized conserved protein, contains HEPN domain [Desulfacinum infernum DSM 9756]|uniref:Uncharacterized conserved protein, contains HEPN domain n=1 Tax=Desulfacinum infernum DSM 9756 TaxID=1121391 RepID=A0A1M4UAQ4_9BACT|nr:DUF86 domain-containing protein [Desulfacinum infernum]SHE53716.1 Uncharacterized conserved protein, contains HEPN domain [Desulfacinum infernum DSM 9756]
MSPRKWQVRLEDMLDAVRKIEAYVLGLTHEDFIQDEKTQDAVIRQLIVLGEAACRLPDELIADTPQIPWYEIPGMRNILVHEYFGPELDGSFSWTGPEGRA